MTEERFGKILSKMRLSKNVTTRQLADMVNMPPSTLADIEHSRSRPCDELLNEIEKALNLNEDERFELEYAFKNDDPLLPFVGIDLIIDEDKTDDEWLDKIKEVMKDNKKEAVNHPDHYHPGKYEVIKVMAEYYGREAVTDFCLLNAFKYVSRAKQKNGLEDIKKAVWYLNYIINNEE